MGFVDKMTDIFPYQTGKKVVIKDPRVGAMTFFTKFVIFFYIVVWQMIHNKEYLECEAPSATVISSIRWPEQLDTDTCDKIGTPITHGIVEGERWYAPKYDYCNYHTDEVHHTGGSHTRKCLNVHDAHKMLIAEAPNFLQLLVTDLSEHKESRTHQHDSEYLYIKGVEELLIDFDLTLLSPTYVEDGMVDNTMGGSSRHVKLTLLDQNGTIVNKCLKHHKKDFDITTTCYEHDPYDSPCVFDINEKFSIPYTALLTATGIPDTGLSTLIDEFKGMHELCVKAFQHGVTRENFQTLYDAHYGNDYVADLHTFADYDAFHDEVEKECSKETLRDFHVKMFISVKYDNLDGSNARFGGPFTGSDISATMTATKQITDVPIFEETHEWECELKNGNETCKELKPGTKEHHAKPYNLKTQIDHMYGTTIKISHSGQLCKFSLIRVISTLNNALVLLALSATAIKYYIKTLPEKHIYKDWTTENRERPSKDHVRTSLVGKKTSKTVVPT